MKITKNKRREFLKNAGSSALFTALGTSFFSSCSEAEETIDEISDEENTEENTETSVGFTVDGNVYTIDLDHPSFSSLKIQGGWKRFDQGAMLIVNVGQNIIRAFTSVCPHAGCRTSWGYSNNNFRCGCHGALFNNQGSVLSAPGGTGDLDSYTAVVENTTLTVSK